MQPKSYYHKKDGYLEVEPSKDTPSGTRYIIKTVMTDKNKKKFRISQNVVVLVYRSDSDSEINIEGEKAKMVKLLAKTKIEYN